MGGVPLISLSNPPPKKKHGCSKDGVTGPSLKGSQWRAFVKPWLFAFCYRPGGTVCFLGVLDGEEFTALFLVGVFFGERRHLWSGGC